MPNWCNNNITIQGPTDTIKTLWEEAEKDGLLNAIKPMPEILKDTTSPAPADIDKVQQQTMIAQTGFDNWYDWRVKNWGVKWDVSTEGLEFTDNGDGTASITGWFDSPWGPPIESYNTFCDDNDNCSLTASYHEPGMDFAGVYEDGMDDYIDGISEHLDNNEPDTWSPLARQLDEEFGIMESIEMWREEENAEA
jgi:hypothetical protein